MLNSYFVLFWAKHPFSDLVSLDTMSIMKGRKTFLSCMSGFWAQIWQWLQESTFSIYKGWYALIFFIIPQTRLTRLQPTVVLTFFDPTWWRLLKESSIMPQEINESNAKTCPKDFFESFASNFNIMCSLIAWWYRM